MEVFEHVDRSSSLVLSLSRTSSTKHQRCQLCQWCVLSRASGDPQDLAVPSKGGFQGGCQTQDRGWVDLISRVSASTPSWDSLGPCRGCLISACARFGSHIWLGVVLKSFGLILQLDDVDKRRFQEQLVDAAQSLLTHLAAATWPCWRHATSLNRLYWHLLP